MFSNILQISHWNDVSEKKDAMEFCEDFIKNNTLAKICAEIPAVNIDKEMKTCLEDIKVILI